MEERETEPKKKSEQLVRDWIIVIGIALSFLVVSLFIYAVSLILNTGEWSHLPEKKFEYINKYLLTAGLFFGGIVGAINAYYGAKRAFAMEKTAEAANKNAEAAIKTATAAIDNAKISQEKQITERFSKAIEQLASEKIEIKLGAIYTLERIAKDSQADRWTIIEVLTAFARENTYLKKEKEISNVSSLQNEGLNNKKEEKELSKMRWDVQELLTVIIRVNNQNFQKNKQLNLSNISIIRSDLTDANFRKANLSDCDFSGAILWRANLSGARLSGANFSKSELVETKFIRASLANSIFIHAIFIYVNFSKANLIQADFSGCGLRETIFIKALLGGANFTNANLSGANFRSAILLGANLTNANLEGANLTNAKLTSTLNANLTNADFSGIQTIEPDQIKTAKNWEMAKYDKEFRIKLGLPPE
jgi:uncharacterized protein YjbI with pentapeptide repeats